MLQLHARQAIRTRFPARPAVQRSRRADVRVTGISEALLRTLPAADMTRPWWHLFPAARTFTDAGGVYRGHHVHETVIQRAIKQAVFEAGLTKRASAQSLRHAFATRLLAAGSDIRTVQTLLGHTDVRTTMRYTHVLNRGGLGVRSPIDRL